MFEFLRTPKESSEDIEAQIAAKEKVLNMFGRATLSDKKELEKLYYKQNLLKRKQNDPR